MEKINFDLVCEEEAGLWQHFSKNDCSMKKQYVQKQEQKIQKRCV